MVTQFQHGDELHFVVTFHVVGNVLHLNVVRVWLKDSRKNTILFFITVFLVFFRQRFLNKYGLLGAERVSVRYGSGVGVADAWGCMAAWRPGAGEEKSIRNGPDGRCGWLLLIYNKVVAYIL